VIAPGRKIIGLWVVQSMMVDSTPTSQAPPSNIKSLLSKKAPSSASTADAVVGETLPNLFAEGAATPAPPCFSNSVKRAKASV